MDYTAPAADMLFTLRHTDCPALGIAEPRLREALDAPLEGATAWLLAPGREPAEVLAGATPYLHLFGLAAGGVLLAKGAVAAIRQWDAGASHRESPTSRPASAARLASA